MINRVVVNGLYGIHSYDIELNKSGVTILTGPNGYGKTTLLNIINALHTCDFTFLCQLSFESIQVSYSLRDGKQMNVLVEKSLIAKTDEASESEISQSTTSRIISVTLFIGDSVTPIEKFDVSLVEKQSKFQQRLGSVRMRLLVGDEPQLLVDEDKSKSRNFRMFMEEYRCSLIREQRIMHESGNRFDEDNIVYEIDEIARQIKHSFEHSQVKFAQTSQQTDATFIERLVHGKQRKYSAEEYQAKLSDLKLKITKLSNYNLISNVSLMEEYPDSRQDVLSLYLDDMEKKLNAFDSFFTQISLFDQFVSSKHLSHKQMFLNRNNGILMLDDNSVPVPLNKMSSGEQNMLILYYNLIFKNNTRSILLIDEPENSLHVAWLTKMLNDYQEMSSRLGCQIIIATHSPAFINGNWDIAYDLEDKSYQG